MGHTRRGKKKNPRFEVSLSIGQKEKNVLLFIQRTFGFGTVVLKHNPNGYGYWYWNVYAQEKIELLAHLFAGNLVLSARQTKFREWVMFGKKFGRFQDLDFSGLVSENKHLKAQCDFISLNNAWLSGFTDAEGCFYAKTRPSKSDLSKIGIEQKWVLIQKDISGQDKAVFEHILNLFQSKNKVRFFSRQHITESTYIETSIESILSQKIVVRYFLAYPLQTKKQKAFMKWYQLYLYRTNALTSNCSVKQLIIQMKKLVQTLNE